MEQKEYTISRGTAAYIGMVQRLNDLVSDFSDLVVADEVYTAEQEDEAMADILAAAFTMERGMLHVMADSIAAHMSSPEITEI